MITPTTITTQDQVYFTRSPINVRLRNLNSDANITSATLYLYVWSGKLNEPPIGPTYTLQSAKVSSEDNYINFQLSELIGSHIDNTKFSWISGDSSPSIAGEGVFWQIRYKIEFENEVQGVTNFATNGYRYDFEQIGDNSNNQPYLNILPINYNRNYTDKVKYFKRDFDFTKTLIDCTSENIISSTVNTPTITKCQLGDKYLIAYINRHGLWDIYTTYGKAVKNIKVASKTSLKAYRNTLSISNSISHSKRRLLDTTEQSYTINTGDLTESMVEQTEDLIMSPLVYLIEFTGETFINTQIGLTVDSTLVSVDSTAYTVDNDTVTADDLGYFSTFKQIPVTNENNNFTFKTRLNDKAKINYDLKFNSTTDRVNNLR